MSAHQTLLQQIEFIHSLRLMLSAIKIFEGINHLLPEKSILAKEAQHREAILAEARAQLGLSLHYRRKVP